MKPLTEPRVAARLQQIAPFHVMSILARAQALEAAGRDIVHLEVGEPDFATPQAITEAGIAALNAGRTHYTPALGLPALRERIAEFHAHRWSARVEPERIAISPGASGALLLAMGVVANPGDEVIMADPGYPCNRHFAQFCDARAVTVPVDAGTDFQLTLELIERHATPATRAVLVSTPANPTGSTIAATELARIRDWCATQGISLIVDEIYLALTYDGDEHSASCWNDVFVVNSFSKYFLMTGWRLGWLVAPEWAMPAIEKLAQNLFLAPSTPAQHAALSAFSSDVIDELESRKAELRTRRDALLPALGTLGFEIATAPRGAFYVYADCSRFTSDTERFTRDLLERAGVAITPGVDFGAYRANTHVRFAYAQPLPRIDEALARIQLFLQQKA